MKKIIIFSSILSLGFLLTGCSTMFGTSNRTISVNSSPENATIYLNGQEYGGTPGNIKIGNPTINSYVVTVKAPGFKTYSEAVETSFQWVGLWNILFWPGFIVDALTGDMMKVTNTSINAKLQKA